MQLNYNNHFHPSDYISKLAVALQPVENDWYELGRTLEVKESGLNEIKKKGDSQVLCNLLYMWSESGESTMMQLENALIKIGRNDVLKGKWTFFDIFLKVFVCIGLHEINDTLSSLNDKAVQCDYLFSSLGK